MIFRDKTIYFVILLLSIMMFAFINKMTFKQEINDNISEIVLDESMIDIDSLTLRQKIAQMIMVRGDGEDYDFTRLNVGGIFLDKQKSEKEYKRIIGNFQDKSKIKLLVATDLEGAWNPFSSLYDSLSFSEIEDKKVAYEIGKEHGKILKSMGFNLNFAPVAEYSDESYGGRVFLGSNEEIEKKIVSYIKGLQENVQGTCKHYPGKGMIGNLHYFNDEQEITEEDIRLFNICFDNGIKAVMIGHQAVTGQLDSNGKPSSVSPEVISGLDREILVFSDEINMRGLSSFYDVKALDRRPHPSRTLVLDGHQDARHLEDLWCGSALSIQKPYNKPRLLSRCKTKGLFDNKIEMYADLINAGENVILDFDLTSKELNNLIKRIEDNVVQKKIKEENINESVRKILNFKGYKVN